jgi:peptide methionine sulfoxide reductase MsrB
MILPIGYVISIVIMPSVSPIHYFICVFQMKFSNIILIAYDTYYLPSRIDAGYWTTTTFVTDAKSMKAGEEITFYDSNTGKALFIAPRGRDMDAFLKESASHGWPSFRDEEVNWDVVRVLDNGEAVSVDGTHLGHNLPDGKGNRYCINLVSVAGKPEGGGKL